MNSLWADSHIRFHFAGTEPKRVLVACEFSGIVRNAFRALGHDAWSCDLLPAEDGSPFHYQMSVRNASVFTRRWDIVIACPPCTHLAVSGARWFKEKMSDQEAALGFVRLLMAFPCERVAIENPIGVISSKIRKPDQIIQPWQFGHGETKATCPWLKGLPQLQPTSIVDGRKPRVHREPPSPDRWKNRSRTYPGIAAAMALQWGGRVSSLTGTEQPGHSGSSSEQAGSGEVDSTSASPISKERIDFEMRLIHNGCAEYNGDEGGEE